MFALFVVASVGAGASAGLFRCLTTFDFLVLDLGWGGVLVVGMGFLSAWERIVESLYQRTSQRWRRDQDDRLMTLLNGTRSVVMHLD